MVDDFSIYQEKLAQTHELLNALDLDAWLIFVRETSMAGDSAMCLIVPFDLTWESALIVGRDGTRTAIVGRYDMQPVEVMDLFTAVHGYDAGIGDLLREVLIRIDPQRDQLFHL